MSTTTLDQAVDQAEETYHAFQVKLKALISTLISHHEMMLKFSSSQRQATTSICDLLINTPISKCVIGTDHCSKTEEDKPSEEDEDDNQNEAKADSTSSKDQSDGPQTVGNYTANEPGRKSEDRSMNECRHSFHSVIGRGKSLEDLEESFMGLFNASNDLNMVYAKRYMEWIVGYLEEWETIVSTRIEGRLIEYRKLRRSYAHYTDKVQGLHEKVVKQKAKKAAKASFRLESKMDRNRLKLSGAEEAHNDIGRSLLSLIEEVTVYYWKDLVPLLHMMIQFSINHSSDLATVMAKLEKTDAILKNISEQHGTSVTGRLADLKPEPVPENIKIQEGPITESIPENAKEKDEEKEDLDSLASESQCLESV